MDEALQATVCFLVKDDEVLLGLKKTGLGAGKYNGIGGKIELGETPEQAAAREVQEEICVTLKKFGQRGFIKFHNVLMPDASRCDIDGYVFVATEWDGEPQETKEMKPKWFKKSNLPLHAMWEDDQYWLEAVLNGMIVKAEFWFESNNKIVGHAITVI